MYVLVISCISCNSRMGCYKVACDVMTVVCNAVIAIGVIVTSLTVAVIIICVVMRLHAIF